MIFLSSPICCVLFRYFFQLSCFISNLSAVFSHTFDRLNIFFLFIYSFVLHIFSNAVESYAFYSLHVIFIQIKVQHHSQIYFISLICVYFGTIYCSSFFQVFSMNIVQNQIYLIYLYFLKLFPSCYFQYIVRLCKCTFEFLLCVNSLIIQNKCTFQFHLYIFLLTCNNYVRILLLTPI